jgi:hypothetical protein
MISKKKQPKIRKLVRCELLKSNPCFNNGKCVNNFYSNKSVGFDCICKRGFKGPLCLDYDPCSLNPCQEDEICLEIGEYGQFTCLCPADHQEYPYCRTELIKSNTSLINQNKLNSNLRRKILTFVNLFLCIVFIILSLIKFNFISISKNLKKVRTLTKDKLFIFK